MSEEDVDIRGQLEAHPRRDDLARLVRTVALSAADERRARFSDGLDELLREAELEPEDGVVGSFNVLRGLSTNEPPPPVGREVLGRLLVRGLALESEAKTDDVDWARLARSLCWLEANTHLAATFAIDGELGEAAGPLWDELRAIVAAADSSGAPKGRGEAVVALVALSASESAAAVAACATLAKQIGDPLFVAALARSRPAGAEPEAEPEAKARALPTAELAGEIVPTPLGPVGLVLWTVSGLIVLRYLFRFVASVVLRCRRPVEITVASAGVTFKSKLDVLGRTVRTQETLIPLGNLARAVREVRYPRLALYAGLTALAVGTYAGVSLATDGARSGSPSLLALGAGVFAVGVVLDMVFSTLLPGKLGKHRVIFVPRSGRTYAVRVADESAADRALRALASSAP